MFPNHIWRYHIFIYLDKYALCNILATSNNFYRFPKQKILWEHLSKQHWSNCLLPKMYPRVVQYFHQLTDLSFYEKRIHCDHTNPIFSFKDLYRTSKSIPIVDVFYHPSENTIIFFTKYRLYLLKLDVKDYCYRCSNFSFFIPNIVDYTYHPSNKLPYLLIASDTQLQLLDINTEQISVISQITQIQYLVNYSETELYCLRDNNIILVNYITRNQQEIWKPVKNKQVKYGCKPLSVPEGLLIPLNNANKLICLEHKTYRVSEVTKKTYDCLIRFSDIYKEHYFICLYKKSIEIRDTRDINQVIYRLEEEDIPIPFPISKLYQYNLAIVGNYLFIRIYHEEDKTYQGMTLNLSSYLTTKHLDGNTIYYDNDDNRYQNRFQNHDKIFYLLPFRSQDKTPNMLVVSHHYCYDHDLSGYRMKSIYYQFRVIYLRNDLKS